jgi:TolB-like protein/tetratricopeptide (TPR) repeat protein
MSIGCPIASQFNSRQDFRMQKTSQKRMRIDLHRFKLHIGLDDAAELTLHFNSASRRFYLSVIALLVIEMKKQGKLFSVPLAKHLDLLALLNETVGGSVGASTRESLLPRIYRKWKSALPDIENAPLFKIVGRNKYYDDGAAKTYRLSETEKDSWANLFEYKGSEENVRLRFSIDALGTNLDDVVLTYGESTDTEAWERFIADLKKERDAAAIPEAAAGKLADETGEKKSAKRTFRRLALAALSVVIVGAVGLVSWNYYLSRPPRVEPASVENMAFPLPNKPSIAVLPFANLSSEKEQEYLCDGLAEGIIDGFAKTDQLFVIARSSSFTYKGKPTKIKQVAEDLGVRYVLEGSIQKAGDRVRITAQLIDALSGKHLFSERYDRQLKDILTLQDEITMKVMTAVQVKLTGGDGAILSAKGTKNLDAYLKVLQAREYKGRTMNKERVVKAMQLFEEAIALDPEYAFAYSYLSMAYFDLVVLGASNSPIESLRRAVELGKKAVALDESNPGAHSMLAYPYMYLKEFDKAISEAEKGISLAPNYAGGYFALGAVLATVGRYKEAIPVLQKCLRLSPVPVHSRVLGILAISCREVGQYEESIATYKKELQFAGPDQLMAHLGMAFTYVLMGREKESHSECAEVMRIDPEFSLERFIKSLPYDQSEKDRVASALRKAGLK